MLNKIRKLLRRAPVAEEPFLRQLADSELFFIAATDSQGIDAKTLTQEQLLAEIRRELERDQQNRRGGYSLFVYSTGTGERRLPIFTSSQHAETFCGEYSRERNRVFPLMVLQTRGGFLATLRPASGERVVLNDKTPDECVLSEEVLATARRMLPLEDVSSGTSNVAANCVVAVPAKYARQTITVTPSTSDKPPLH